jgi:hypothetical protein
MVERHGTCLFGASLCRIKFALIPPHQSPRQKGLRMLGCGGRRRACYGDSLLEERDRLRLGGDTQVDAQNFAQALELTNGGLSVAAVELCSHEGTACLFVGSIDLEDVLPPAGATEVFEPARPQSFAVRLNPFAVRILRQKVC